MGFQFGTSPDLGGPLKGTSVAVPSVASTSRRVGADVVIRPTGTLEIQAEGNPVLVISTGAPVDTDGRPDGTVYIQTGA